MIEDAATREQLEQEANRLLAEQRARLLRAKIESSAFTEEEGRRMYERIPGSSSVRPGHDDNGNIVPIVNARGVGREWENAIEVTARAMRDMGEVAGFELGVWAGKNPAKQYAVRAIRLRTNESVRHFAARAGVSESLVHRRIREAKRLASSLSVDT